MRATERLLGVIGEIARRVDEGELLTEQGITQIRQAAAELRRRGDTLVRARDLELVVQALSRERVLLGEDEAQAHLRYPVVRLSSLEGDDGHAPAIHLGHERAYHRRSHP
jgi:hypothetical protein